MCEKDGGEFIIIVFVEREGEIEVADNRHGGQAAILDHKKVTKHWQFSPPTTR